MSVHNTYLQYALKECVRNALYPESARAEISATHNDMSYSVLISIDGWYRQLTVPHTALMRAVSETRPHSFLIAYLQSELGLRYLKFPQTWDREDD